MQLYRKLTAMTCNHCSGARGFLDRETMCQKDLKVDPVIRSFSSSFSNFPLQVGMI